MKHKIDLRRTWLKGSLIVLAGSALQALAQAQTFREQMALQDRLQKATRVECSFPTRMTGTWTQGAAKGEVGVSQVVVKFVEVNVDEGTAEEDGKFGQSFIAVRYSNGYLHFLQAFSSGPLYVTTVLARAGAEGRFLAMHTRHEYTAATVPGFTSQPEMYLGECVVENTITP